jgi:hypothetical protein
MLKRVIKIVAILKNAVSWDMALCESYKNRHVASIFRVEKNPRSKNFLP